MNHTIPHRVRQAFGVWSLLRYESRLFRWSPPADRPDSGAPPARWLGNTSLRGRSFHALFCPVGSVAAYRFLAPPSSRIVAWCALLPIALRNDARGTFTVTIVREGERVTTNTVHLSGGSGGDHAWRKVVVEVGNREAEQIEVRLTTHVPESVDASAPWAVWGEPRIEWPRPLAEVVDLIRFVARPALRGRLIHAVRLLHRRLSSSTNPALYQAWLARHTPSADDLARMRATSETFGYRPLISIVTPVFNTDAQWLRACIESVKRQAYPQWQLCLVDDGSTKAETRKVLEQYTSDPRIRVQMLAKNSGIANASNVALAMCDGEFVAFLDHDDEITADALFEVVSVLNEHRDADLLYSDEDKLEIDGSFSGPYFKPAWSPEHFLTNMYTCHLMVVRRALIERIGGFRSGYDGAQDYDLVLRLIEQTARLRHVPKVLYHWRKIPESTAGTEGAKPWAHDAGRLALEDYVRRNRLSADVLPGAYPYVYRVRYAIQGEPLISIVPARLEDRDAIERWRQTLAARTSYRRFEVVPTTEDAKGDHLLFLDPRLRPLDGDWLTALLEFSQQEAIGAVGGKLFYADGSLKHIGLLLGVGGAAAPAFHRHPQSSLGYWGTAIAARNYSAVSGACLMTRRGVYEQVSGFRDECGAFADVDYCLRVSAARYRVVFTPHAVLGEHGSSEPVTTTDRRAHAQRLQSIWGDRLARDPYYNANLSRESPDYEPNLATRAARTGSENAQTPAIAKA